MRIFRYPKLLITGLAIIVTAGVLAGIGVRAHAAQQTLPSSPTYVALGDSVAAGAGILPYEGSSEAALCGRSTASYPDVLAAKLHTTATNIACSGAKSSFGAIGAQTIKNPNGSTTATMPSQIDRAFQNGKPDLITITIGANDVDWVNLVGKCYVSDCGSTADTAYAKTLRGAFELKLGATLAKIKQRSGNGTPPRVLVTGYYQPVSSVSCLGGRVTPSELTWINSQTDSLNNGIRKAVSGYAKVSSWFKSYSFATYVPISFAGHGMCSNAPWVQGLTDSAPLHPNTVGAAQIANTLLPYAR